jgi:hypothetical protein
MQVVLSMFPVPFCTGDVMAMVADSEVSRIVIHVLMMEKHNPYSSLTGLV